MILLKIALSYNYYICDKSEKRKLLDWVPDILYSLLGNYNFIGQYLLSKDKKHRDTFEK